MAQIDRLCVISEDSKEREKKFKKLVCISKLSKNNNSAEVEMKHGGTRYTILIGNQFSCDCNSLQMVNCKTHIVWVLLNLMEVGEGNKLIAQVEIGHAALMQMLSKVLIEIPLSSFNY